jgi:tetratricopeptide (TPR) repeat protein
MGQKKLDEAIRVFERNVELYPKSANVYDSLGEGYENAGKLDLAVQNIEKAITKGSEIHDPNLDQYKEHLKRVQLAKAAGKSK